MSHYTQKKSGNFPSFPILVLLLLVACSNELTQLDRIQSRNVLRVAMIATPPIYFPNETIIQGYGYEAVAEYAKSIETDIHIIRAATVTELMDLLKQGKAHIAITGSSPIFPDEKVISIANYYETNWHVIGNQKNKLPDSFDEITPSKLIVAKGSRPALVLPALKKNHPDLFWLELPKGNSRQVMEQVNQNNFKLSLIDHDVYSYYRYLYPETRIAFSLKQKFSSHWYVHNREDDSLRKSIAAFMKDYKRSGKLEKKYDTYFRHLNVFNYIDYLYYLRRIQIKLPEYAPIFKKAAKENSFDERFLAAISYQESHWNEKARSHTGVRGLMMLTNDTAKRVGVTDRLDPEQSIMGGAQYLNILKQSLPENIPEPERSWMTLAAYNVGLGHLQDARVLTETLGDNPDIWIDVEKHLPKLSQKKWHSKTKHGYARGHEPVEFVRRVRRYYDVLRLFQQEAILEQLDEPMDWNKININAPVL